jgi:hypothetical protein
VELTRPGPRHCLSVRRSLNIRAMISAVLPIID